MKKRSYLFFGLLMGLLSVSVWFMGKASTNLQYIQAAGSQNLYKLTVSNSRGMIYDCNMQPLVNQTERTVAAVAPGIETMAELNRTATAEDRIQFASYLESGKPFLYEVDARIKYEELDVFHVQERYAQNQIAAHLIGYTDSMGNGVTGIEASMNDVLKRNNGELAVYYRTDAFGRVIAGAEKEIVDTRERSKAGIVLTIDSLIQQKAEDLAKQLGKGSIIVAEAPHFEIRALASVPSYSPKDLAKASKSSDGPLVNRAFAAYSPGSVFKLAVAKQAIEEGLDGFVYDCKGYTTVNGMHFHCYNSIPHGKINLQQAIEQSCNSYFIHLGERLGGTSLLATASNLGFGKSMTFGEGLTTAAGNLPLTKELKNERALANFSFGQGSLTVTPLQIAGLIHTIASGGEYTEPKLVAGTVDNALSYLAESEEQTTRYRAMSEETAKQIQTAMESVIKNGTGKAGKPENIKAGAKTGTAQTGVYENNKEQNHYWFAGYIKEKNIPRYVIVVMRESVVSDDGVTAGIFKELADYIEKQIF